MKHGRTYFGICCIGHLITVIGGANRELRSLESCESFDIFTDEWHELPTICKVNDSAYPWGIAIEVIRKRFIFGLDLAG